MVERWQRDLGRQVWEAKTATEARAIIAICEQRFHCRPVAVGRENNIGTINIASDSGLALVERLTNGLDSLIELAVKLNPATSEPASPEAAVRLFFAVPAGGHGDMSESERRSLGENLTISMRESGVPKRPSICITDLGIGQHPTQFSKTLLSLNETNKVGQYYTMGTFGQGGSTTLGFSNYAILCSRRHPDLLEDGEPDSVGFTLAYEEDTDPNTSKLPRYVWIVDESGLPFQLPTEAFPELEHGTRVMHIEYDCQGLEGQFTTQMWQFLNNALFDPVLPFVLEGDRTPNERLARSRVILGNHVRLSHVDRAKGDLAVAAHDAHKIMLQEYGSVTAKWWVLERPVGSTSRSDPVDSYAKPDSAVVMTLHGQRQATQRRTWLKDTTKLPFLYKQMIVNINTNDLNGLGRRLVYASTRERARQSDLSRRIFDEVAQLIREDETLKQLNHEARERRLAESSRAANEKVQKRLSQFIKTRLRDTSRPGGRDAGREGQDHSGDVGTQSGHERGKRKRTGGRKKVRDISDSHLHNVPFHLRFDSKKLSVAVGFSTDVWVCLDAKNGYLPEHALDLTTTFVSDDNADTSGLRVKSMSMLLGGRSRWKIQASQGTKLGHYQFKARLMTANGMLSDSIPLEVVNPPEPNRSGRGGQEEDTGPEIHWIIKDQWETDIAGKTFTSKTVGDVTADDEKTVIFVNRDFSLLAKAMGSRNLTPEMIETRRDRYLYPVACGLWLQHHENQRIPVEDRPDDAYLEGEMARLAEAVIVAIDPDVDLARVTSD